MNKTAPSVATLWYETTDRQGRLLDSSGNKPIEIIIGSTIARTFLEEHLMTMTIGEQRTVQLTPEQAFGAYDPQGMKTIDMPGHRYEAGDTFLTEDGQEAEVKSVNGGRLTIDTNHPFAGKELVVSIRLIGKRIATSAEIEAGEPLTQTGSCCGPEGCC